MAAANQKNRRTAPVTNGSLAYDLSRQTPPAQRYSTAPKLEPKPQTRPREKAAPRPAHRVMTVAPAAVLLFAAALMIWVASLQTRTQITQAQRDIYRLESQLRAIEQVQDELQIQYESAFSFTQMEDYAVGTLGMQRPRDEQVYFLSQNSEDHAVAVAERAKSNGIVDRMEDVVKDFLSYFR